MPSKFRWLIWFALCNGLAWALMSAFNIPLQEWTPSLGSFFLLLGLCGHFIFLSWLLALALAPGVLLCRRFGAGSRVFIALCIVCFSLAMMLMAVNTVVFSVFRYHLNGMVWNMFLGGAALEILEFSLWMWLSIIAALALIVVLEIGLAYGLLRLRLPLAAPLVCVALLMVVGQGLFAISDLRADYRVISKARYIPWAQPLQLKGWAQRHNYQLEQAQLGPEELSSLDSELIYPRAPLRCKPPQGKARNVLLLLIDSLRFDVLNPRVMPESWAFAQSALRFENHYSLSHATRFGMFSLLYGLPGRYWFPVLSARVGSALFTELKKLDYSFALYASAPLNSPEFDRTAFVELSDQLYWPRGDYGPARRDQMVVERFERFLEQRDERPFFAMLFLDAPHGYALPKNAEKPFQPALDSINYMLLDDDYDPEPLFNLYRSSVFYTDKLIGRALAALERSGLSEETIVILTSDHGQEFNDLNKNYWGHNGNFSDYQIKVSLALRWPGRAPERIQRETTHLDIVPTLMRDMLACDNPIRDYSSGVSLFDSGEQPRLMLVNSWSRNALRYGDRIYEFQRFGGLDIFDLRYELIEGEELPPELLKRALEEQGRFYSHGKF